MKACVIGGTGFVGMNLIRALVSNGHDAVATRRVRANTLFARRLGVPLIKAEIEDEDALVEAMRGREVAFMCAGHYPRYSLDRDAEVATARARVRTSLKAAQRAGVQRYVLTSSVATVGPPESKGGPSVETDPPDQRAARCIYHAVKLAIEEEVLAACHQGLDVVILCPTAIFGELDVKAGTGFLVVAMGNDALPFYVDGKINVVDADDVAQAHVLAAEYGRTGERYIVGSHNLRVKELLQIFARTMDRPFRVRRLPVAAAGWLSTFSEWRARSATNGQRPLMARELVDLARFGQWVDGSKARKELGFNPLTELQTTVSKSCNWYIRHRYVKQAAATATSDREEPPAKQGKHYVEHSQLSDT